MKYFTLSIEEDSRRCREFMRTQLFRNANRTLTRLETEAGGLTPAEVWQEVEGIINELRGMEVDDRDVMVSQITTNLRRKLKKIERDDEQVVRGKDEQDRTITCILYCLALRLEATTKQQDENPHNDLLDALVEELDHINHQCLPLLFYFIKADGERNENRNQFVEEEDPLRVKDGWLYQMSVVVNHYANRMNPKVERHGRDAFDRFWDIAQKDMMFSGLLRMKKNIAGDEHTELGFDYNSTFIFNVYGLLYKHAFFNAGEINGWDPLAKAVTYHYDGEKLKYVKAKQEYFKFMEAGILPQYNSMSADQLEHVEGLLKQACGPMK